MAASVSKEAQDAVLRKLETLSKDEQLAVLRTSLERRLGESGQVCPPPRSRPIAGRL